MKIVRMWISRFAKKYLCYLYYLCLWLRFVPGYFLKKWNLFWKTFIFMFDAAGHYKNTYQLFRKHLPSLILIFGYFDEKWLSLGFSIVHLVSEYEENFAKFSLSENLFYPNFSSTSLLASRVLINARLPMGINRFLRKYYREITGKLQGNYGEPNG